MRKSYTEPTNYFPKEVMDKYPLKGTKSTASKTKKKTTTKKSK